MAQDDFCFVYYDGDAARDKAHMNRLERGAYDDFISAQRKRGHLSIDDVKKVLGGDFDSCWPSLEWILEKDEEDKFFIKWVEKSISRRQAHSDRQRKNAGKRWHIPKDATALPPQSHGTTTAMPLEQGQEQGNEIENEFKEGGAGETVYRGVVPAMVEIFKEHFPKYLFDRLADYSAVKLIGDKLAEWDGVVGDMALAENVERIKLRWGEVVIHVKSDPHFTKYSLTQINKYLQGILQSLTSSKNGTGSNRVTPSKSGKSAGANGLVEKLNTRLNNRRESGNSG